MNKDDTPNDEPYNSEISELTLWELFYGDKRDWYEEVDGVRDWDKGLEKIHLFWKGVRDEKMSKIDLDFSGFVFPEFLEESFWLEDVEREFRGEANFFSARFSESANFGSVTFTGEARFNSATFSERVDFSSATFSDRAIFGLVSFIGVANFISAKFSKRVDFNSLRFSGVAIFRSATFSGVANFTSATFSERVDFISVTFSEVSFEQTHFQKAIFIGTRFSFDHRTLFESWTVSERVEFEKVILPDKVQFQHCNMENVVFKSCDLVKVNFSNCDFKIRRNRIVLGNDKGEDHSDLANTYRQIKRNRMDAKNWTEAGDAYRSEMVMVRRKIQRSILTDKIRSWRNLVDKLALIFNLGVRALYEHGSGYQQSLARPIFCLLVMIFGFAWVFAYTPALPYLEGLKMSINASLPLVGKIDDQGDRRHWVFFALVIERLFSVIFLAFFILATRVRLRQ